MRSIFLMRPIKLQKVQLATTASSSPSLAICKSKLAQRFVSALPRIPTYTWATRRCTHQFPNRFATYVSNVQYGLTLCFSQDFTQRHEALKVTIQMTKLCVPEVCNRPRPTAQSSRRGTDGKQHPIDIFLCGNLVP